MCNDSYPIMGGYNILTTPNTNQYFQRYYNNLPTHTAIYFTATIYAVDTWDDSRGDNDYFALSFDGTSTTQVTGLSTNRFFEYVCGPPGTYLDLRNLRVFGSMPHTANTLTFQMISGVHQTGTDESLGFRDVNLIFASPATPTTSICASGPGPVVDITPKCTCNEGYYYSGSSCVACDSSCTSCYGAGATQCYQCKSGYSYISGTCTQCYSTCSACTGSAYNQCVDCMTGYFLYDGNQCVSPCNAPLVQTDLIQTPSACTKTCSSPCDDPNDYMYWDGSCNSTCPYPLKSSVTLGNIPTCTFPCADGQYLYADGKCSATCTSPLTDVEINGQQFCLTPCTTAGEFLMWNGTCTTTCEYPLTNTYVENVYYCQYPCTNIGTDYLYFNGSCLSTCEALLTPRSENGYLFCDWPLEDTTAYLYWNGTGASTCNPPLSIRTEGSPITRKFCDYPCLTTQYLYWDGSCQSSCPFPYDTAVEGDRNFCRYPCQATENLYWNGSCLATCPSPYTQTTPHGSNFCSYTCTSSQYLYWDDSCDSSCLSPLTIGTAGTTSTLYCAYPCAATEYLYWNGTCSSSCDFPLTTSTIKSKNLCDYPCSDTQFLYYNGTCSDNCLLPYQEHRENGKGFCNYPCSSTEFLFWNGSCVSECNSPMTVTSGSYGEQYCNTPCTDPMQYYMVETGECLDECDTNSTMQEDLYLRCIPAAPVVPDEYSSVTNLLMASDATFSLLSMAKLSEHVRYLEVDQPTRLEALSVSRSRSFLTLKFLPDMSDSMVSKFVYMTLPTVFSRLGIHSSFVVNYWPSVMTLLIGFGIALILWGLTFVFRSHETDSVLSNLRTIFKWNFCFVLVAINVDDIIMYGYIDFSTMQLKNSNATLSLFVLLCMLFLAVLTIILAFVFARKFQLIRKEANETKNFDNYEKFLVSWQSWQVLYRGFVENSLLRQSFYIIYIIRLGAPMVITIALLTKPVSQSVCHLLISLFILGYILHKCPFKKRINQVQLVIVETFALIINICCLILAIQDYKDSTNSKQRVWIGDIIILCNFAINITILIFLVVKLLIEVSNIQTLRKVHPNKSNAAWVRLLAIVIEQGAFGFEEILEDTWYARQSAEHPEVDLLNPPPVSLFPPKEDETQINLKEDDKKEKLDPGNPIFHFPHNAEFYSAYGSVEAKNNDFYNEKIRTIKKKYTTTIKKPEEEIELDDNDTNSPTISLTRNISNDKKQGSPAETLTSFHGRPADSSFINENHSPSIISLGGEMQSSPLIRKSSPYDRLSLLKKRSTQKNVAAQELQEEQLSPESSSPIKLTSEQHSPGSLMMESDNSPTLNFKPRNLSRTSNRSSRTNKKSTVYPETFQLDQ